MFSSQSVLHRIVTPSQQWNDWIRSGDGPSQCMLGLFWLMCSLFFQLAWKCLITWHTMKTCCVCLSIRIICRLQLLALYYYLLKLWFKSLVLLVLSCSLLVNSAVFLRLVFKLSTISVNVSKPLIHCFVGDCQVWEIDTKYASVFMAKDSSSLEKDGNLSIFLQQIWMLHL